MPKDEVKAWLAPLLAEAFERGIELSAETLIAAKPKEGQLNGSMNWLLLGQLVIQRLGLEGSYPAEPAKQPRGFEFYHRIIAPELYQEFTKPE